MTPRRGWYARGKRLVDKVPNRHWKTLTFIRALRCDRMCAPYVLDGPINAVSFLAWIQQCLIPTLKHRDIVVMDNLGSDKAARSDARSGPQAPCWSSCRHTART